jgi:hypothetical protein
MTKKYKVFKEIVIISIMTTIINGWEYLTSIIPGDVMTQTLQNEYIKEQSIAYHMLLSHMCIPHEELKEVKEKKLYIDCNDNIINPESSYHVKFSKTKFLKTKLRRIKRDLYNYYNSKGFLVKGPYELQLNIYCIDLVVNKEFLNNKTEDKSDDK